MTLRYQVDSLVVSKAPLLAGHPDSFTHLLCLSDVKLFPQTPFAKQQSIHVWVTSTLAKKEASGVRQLVSNAITSPSKQQTVHVGMGCLSLAKEKTGSVGELFVQWGAAYTSYQEYEGEHRGYDCHLCVHGL